MPIWEVELEDGRIAEFESDNEPTERDVFSALQSYKPDAAEQEVSAIAPWMAEREQPSSLTPQQSPFGLPESFKFAPLQYKEHRSSIGPQDPWETYVKLSDAELFPDEETREHLIATGQIPPRSAWENAQRPALIFPTAPNIEDSHPSEFEQALAPSAFGLMGLALGGERSSQVLREGYNVAKGVPEFMTSPLGVATLPAGMVAPRAVTGTFAYDMLKSLLEQDEQLQANWENMSEPERLRALTRMGMTGAFAGHLAKTSTKSPKFSGTRGEAFRTPLGGPEAALPSAYLGEAYSRTFNSQIPVRGNVTARPSGNIAAMPGSQVGQARTEAERAAEESPEDVVLTPEEDSLLMSEAWAVDLPVKVVQKGSRARAAANRGQLMGINFKTGEIEVYPANFRVALEGVPEAARGEFIRSRLQGEQFHKSVFDSIGNAGASKYWGNLTRAEQKLAARIYLGRQNTTGFSRSDLGHEVIRRRLQRLENGTPEEMIGVARREKWTLKSLQLLEDVIRTTREKVPTYGKGGLKLGTKAARSNKALMDRLDRNMAAARSAVTGSPEEDAEVAEELVADQPELGSNYAETSPTQARLDEMVALQTARDSGMLDDPFDIARLKRLEGKYGQGPASSNRGPISIEEADSIVKEKMGSKWFASAFKDMNGKTLFYTVGYSRKGSPDIHGLRRNITTRKGRGDTVEEALEDAGIEVPESPDTGPASSVRSERRPDPPIPESEFPPFPKPGNRLITIRRSDGTTYRAGLDERQTWDERYLPPGITSGKMIHRITLDKGEPFWSTGMLDAGETIVGEPALGPAASRRGPMSRRGEDAAKLAAMRSAQAEGKMEAGVEAGALRQSAFEPVTPERAMAEAERYVMESKETSFEDFSGSFRSKFGDIPNGQLRELFAQNIGEALIRVPGKRVGEMLKSMGLVKQVIGGGKPGERRLGTIPDALGLPAREPELRQAMMSLTGEESPLEISTALARAIRRKGPPTARGTTPQQRLRFRALGAILHKLFKETEGMGRSIERKTVTPEEIGSPITSKEPVYGDIRASELTDVDRLGKTLTSDARSFNRPVSASKRLVAMLNKQSGAIDLVDIYLDPRRGAVVMSPTGAGAHQSLESAMRTHRPIHSILLDEPVQNFRQRFKSLKEYNDEFGTDARSRAQEAQYEEFVGEPVGDPELESGPVESSGTLARPEFRPGRGVLETEAPITDAEARATLEFIKSEVSRTGEITSPEDVALAVESFRELIKRPIKDRPLRAISGIIKMVKSQMEQNDQLTEGEALQQVAKFIYETQSRTTPDQFVGITLANYRGRTAEAGEGITDPLAAEQAGAVRGREAIAEQQAVKRAQWLAERGFPKGVEPPEFPFEPEVRPESVTRNLEARPSPPIEGVGGGLASTMTRGTEVRRAAAEAAVPARAEAIRQESMTPEEARFDQLVQNMGEMQRQVDAEIAAEQAQGPAATLRRKVFKEIEHDIDKAEAELVNQFVIGPGKSFAEWYSGWLTQNIRRNGGVRAGQAADIGNIVIDRTKQIYGDLTPTLNEALVLAGGTKEFPLFQQLPTRGQIRTTIWLNRLSHPASMDTAVSRTVGAVEGDFVVPRFAQETVNAAKASNLEIGGLILEHPQGKFQRNMTAWGYDIMIRGTGEVVDGVKQINEFDVYVRDSAKINSTVENFNEVEAGMITMWGKWREENLKPTPDINVLEKINQDFIRQWPNVVTHVKTQFGYQQVIHTDLHNYLKNSALRTSHVAAFREQFPNTTEGKARLAVLDKDVRNELKDKGSKDWDALIKTMQGKPTDTYNRFGPLAPGRPWAEFTRALNDTAVATARRMVLTGQMVTQGPETVVAPFVYFSPKNVIQSAIRFRELWPLMEKTGQINKLTYDFSIDPANPIRSAFRFGGNLLSKMYFEHFLNEFQGKWFAANATVAVERMRAGKMSSREMRDLKETFRQTGFTGEQATRMMEGDAELLGQFQRRMPAWAVGENRLLAEGSRLGANRLFNSIFRFQMYPMLKMNQFKMAMGRVIEANETGTKSERFATRKRLVEVTFGTALQGAMLAVVAAYFFGGREGLKMKVLQAWDDPVDFMIESLLGAMSGPLYMVWSGARYGGLMGIGEQATRLAFPFSVGANLIEASAGVGQYKDMDAWDRIGKFLSQKTPGFRIMRTMMAEWALGEENPKLEANLKALGQWKRDTWKNKKFPEGSEHNRAFRIQMKKAVEAMIAEDMEARQKALDKALEIKINEGLKMKEAEQDVAKSFQGRTVLKNPETHQPLNGDEKDALKKRIGEDAFKRLEWFDNMLKDAGKNPSSVE